MGRRTIVVDGISLLLRNFLGLDTIARRRFLYIDEGKDRAGTRNVVGWRMCRLTIVEVHSAGRVTRPLLQRRRLSARRRRNVVSVLVSGTLNVSLHTVSARSIPEKGVAAYHRIQTLDMVLGPSRWCEERGRCAVGV
jgi:hypothetical protein